MVSNSFTSTHSRVFGLIANPLALGIVVSNYPNTFRYYYLAKAKMTIRFG